MAIRLVDMPLKAARSAMVGRSIASDLSADHKQSYNSTDLIPFAAGTYTAGDPKAYEPMRKVEIERKFGTFPGEVTNADVRQIANHMTAERKFGIFGLDANHGPILLATSPDTNEDNFEMVDPKLYGPELGITDWNKQQDRIVNMEMTQPVQIIPDENRYETWFRKWGRTDATHFAQNEMAATVVTWWEAKALALFLAGAQGLSGTSDLLSSAQFDAMVQGLKYMTRSGHLFKCDPNSVYNSHHSIKDMNHIFILSVPLRPFELEQIVPVNDPQFPSLTNGLRPNTTNNWTRTGRFNENGGPFELDLNRLFLVTRGGSWASLYNGTENNTLKAAARGWLDPDGRSISLGFRVAVTAKGDAPRGVEILEGL